MKHTLLWLGIVLLVSPLAAEGPNPFVKMDQVHIGLTSAVPLGDFKEIADFGIGLQGKLPLSIIDVPGLTLTPSLAGIYYLTPLDTVTGIVSFKVDLFAGYRFSLSDALTLSPSLGYGILVFLAMGESAGVFMDSGLTLAVEGSYSLTDLLKVYLEPVYQFFLEDGANGQQLIINAGIVLALGGEK